MKESREKKAFGRGYTYADSTASGTDTHGLRNACKKGGIENKVSVNNKQSRKPASTIYSNSASVWKVYPRNMEILRKMVSIHPVSTFSITPALLYLSNLGMSFWTK